MGAFGDAPGPPADHRGGELDMELDAEGGRPVGEGLVAEDIAFGETQAYVRLVYEHYYMYTLLWGAQP